MTYSVCRFWAYDESKKIVGATGKDAPMWKLATAGSMAGGIAGLVGNPGEILMVCHIYRYGRGYTSLTEDMGLRV